MEDRRQLAKPWLQRAENDVELARRALTGKPLPALACFLSQQAAEKALKAMLVLRGEQHIPHTHDLERLAEALSHRGVTVPAEGATLAWLTVYATAGRYPGLGPDPDVATARRALKIAERILEWASAV